MLTAPRRWLRRLTLGKKLLTAFGLLFFLLTLSLVAILFYLTRINSYVERHNRITIPAVVTVAAFREQLYDAEAFIQRHLKGQISDARAVRTAEMRRLVRAMRARLDLYRQVHAANTHPVLHDMLMRHGQGHLASEEETALDAMTTQIGLIAERWEALLATDPKLVSGSGLAQEATRQASELARGVTRLMQLHARIDGEMKIEGDVLLHQATFVILALVTLLGLMLAATYRLVTTEIIQPLRCLASIAQRVAHHDLSADFEPWPARDEVGTLSGALRSMLGTLRHRTRSLERKTQELETFTSSVAHDLKAPLRDIEGFAALLTQRLRERASNGSLSMAPDPTIAHYLERIRSSSVRMATLIHALLQYSRIEQQSLPKSRVNVRQLIDDIVRPYSTQHPEGVPPSITVDLPFSEIYGEPSTIRQVFANLLDNAIKFSGSQVRVDVAIGGRLTDDERILWVRDRGIGFDPKDRDRIFKLFERLPSSEHYDGTGVGLAIVKLVMDKHAGRIWVESSPGKGSTFYVAFPSEDVKRES